MPLPALATLILYATFNWSPFIVARDRTLRGHVVVSDAMSVVLAGTISVSTVLPSKHTFKTRTPEIMPRGLGPPWVGPQIQLKMLVTGVTEVSLVVSSLP